MERQNLGPTCPYCKQPVTDSDYPCKGLDDGNKAHLDCFISHMNDEEKNPPKPHVSG